MTAKDVPIRFIEGVIFSHERRTNQGDESGRILREDLSPGDAQWGEGDYILYFVCPCGCSAVYNLPVCKGKEERGRWLWDGDRQRPSLTPSIARPIGCMWHGYLTAGVFTLRAPGQPATPPQPAAVPHPPASIVPSEGFRRTGGFDHAGGIIRRLFLPSR